MYTVVRGGTPGEPDVRPLLYWEKPVGSSVDCIE